jgi:hypothetical protein
MYSYGNTDRKIVINKEIQCKTLLLFPVLLLFSSFPSSSSFLVSICWLSVLLHGAATRKLVRLKSTVRQPPSSHGHCAAAIFLFKGHCATIYCAADDEEDEEEEDEAEFVVGCAGSGSSPTTWSPCVRLSTVLYGYAPPSAAANLRFFFSAKGMSSSRRALSALRSQPETHTT